MGQPRGKKRCALGGHISKQQKAGLGHPFPQRPHGDSGAPQPGDGKKVHSGGTREQGTGDTHPVRGDSGAPPPADPRKERKKKRKPFTHHLRNKKENPSHTTSETKKKTLHTPPKKQKRKPFTHHLRNQKKKKRSGVGQPRGKKRCALGRHISKQQKAGLGHPSPQRPHGDSGAPQPGDGGKKKENPSHLHLQNQTQWWWSWGRSGVCTREAHKSRQQKAGLVHPSPQGLMETRELHNLGVEKTVHSGGTQGTHPVRGDSGAPSDPQKKLGKKKKKKHRDGKGRAPGGKSHHPNCTGDNHEAGTPDTPRRLG